VLVVLVVVVLEVVVVGSWTGVVVVVGGAQATANDAWHLRRTRRRQRLKTTGSCGVDRPRCVVQWSIT
jgi:hypothetical protein